MYWQAFIDKYSVATVLITYINIIGLAATLAIVVLNNKAKVAVIIQLHSVTSNIVAVTATGYNASFFKVFIVLSLMFVKFSIRPLHII